MRLFGTIIVAILCIADSAAAEELRPLPEPRDPFAASKYQALHLQVGDDANGQTAGGHPMLPALRYAYQSYRKMRTNVHDYRGKLVMRERIQGRLKPWETMEIKVRHAAVDRDNQIVPFAVYLNFLAPKRYKGREVLYAEGQNDNKMVATRGGGKALNDITLWLRPDGKRAMRGKHHPISDFGIMNLASRIIEYGTEEMEIAASRDVRIQTVRGAKINKRSCTMIEVTHPTRQEGLRYHIARIFVDDELEVPVRFAAYSWPPKEGDLPLLMEEYTYVDLELNVGFSDADFDATNSAYHFREARPAEGGSSSPRDVARVSHQEGDK